MKPRAKPSVKRTSRLVHQSLTFAVANELPGSERSFDFPLDRVSRLHGSGGFNQLPLHLHRAILPQ
jgi:hypothetical protein